MKTAKVIIGCNYGDEGKGLITDYLVDREKIDVVVRFNGGAQAGHTVVTPDGRAHTFRHFSSGTFLGAKTFLSRYFVLNPMLYFKESAEIKQLVNVHEHLFVDPRAFVTTPWDIIANQARERAAGDQRLGSCGVGHRDTVDRNEYSEFGFTVGEVLEDFTHDYLISKLEFIRGKWLPERLAEYRVPYSDELRELALSAEIMENYLRDLKLMVSDVLIVEARDLPMFGKVLFEGSQGLGLDQHHGTLPHVTRSNTGLKNVVDICEEAGIDEVEVYYTTRAYLTRHGVGPMEVEIETVPPGWKEVSNVTNEFQGAFRFGFLDSSALKDRIKNDLWSAQRKIKLIPKLVVTCIDHLGDFGEYFINGKVKRVRRDDFAATLAQDLNLLNGLESRGPTRTDVKEIVR